MAMAIKSNKIKQVPYMDDVGNWTVHYYDVDGNKVSKTSKDEILIWSPAGGMFEIPFDLWYINEEGKIKVPIFVKNFEDYKIWKKLNNCYDDVIYLNSDEKNEDELSEEMRESNMGIAPEKILECLEMSPKKFLTCCEVHDRIPTRLQKNEIICAFMCEHYKTCSCKKIEMERRLKDFEITEMIFNELKLEYQIN
jgi:hypothetical protein